MSEKSAPDAATYRATAYVVGDYWRLKVTETATGHTVLDWTLWPETEYFRPASAGHTLIECGYMLVRREGPYAGWRLDSDASEPERYATECERWTD